jgi:hypothetical protein
LESATAVVFVTAFVVIYSFSGWSASGGGVGNWFWERDGRREMVVRWIDEILVGVV